MPIPGKVSTLDALGRLRLWLNQLGSSSSDVGGSSDDGGVSSDVRISVTYCPGKVSRNFSNSTAHLLDRSGVEQIFCSRKAEDADRKIIARLQQEAAVLEPKTTAFVLISSDLDFNVPIATQIARGFTVVVLCGRSLRAQQCFALHASAVHVWEDIASGRPSARARSIGDGRSTEDAGCYRGGGFSFEDGEVSESFQGGSANLDRSNSKKTFNTSPIVSPLLVPSQIKNTNAPPSATDPEKGGAELKTKYRTPAKAADIESVSHHEEESFSSVTLDMSKKLNKAICCHNCGCQGHRKSECPSPLVGLQRLASERVGQRSVKDDSSNRVHQNKEPERKETQHPPEGDELIILKKTLLQSPNQNLQEEGGVMNQADGEEDSEALEDDEACMWDNGPEDESEIVERSVAHFCSWMRAQINRLEQQPVEASSPKAARSWKKKKGANSSQLPASSVLIETYYRTFPGSAVVFQGKMVRLQDGFPELKSILDELKTARKMLPSQPQEVETEKRAKVRRGGRAKSDVSPAVQPLQGQVGKDRTSHQQTKKQLKCTERKHDTISSKIGKVNVAVTPPLETLKPEPFKAAPAVVGSQVADGPPVPALVVRAVTKPSSFMVGSSLDGASAALVESIWTDWAAVRDAAELESTPPSSPKALSTGPASTIPASSATNTRSLPASNQIVCFPEVGVPRITSTRSARLNSLEAQPHSLSPLAHASLAATVVPPQLHASAFSSEPTPHSNHLGKSDYLSSLALRIDATNKSLERLRAHRPPVRERPFYDL